MRSIGSPRSRRCPASQNRTSRPLLVLRLDLYVAVGLICERPGAGCITPIVYFIDHLGVFCASNVSNLRGCYNAVTRAPTVGNDLLVPDSKRERGVHARAMLFWVLAALAVVGALAIVRGLYLLVRRWL